MASATEQPLLLPVLRRVIGDPVKPALKCRICKKDVAPRAANPSYPFCSPRCRQVDLGKWLGEEYRVPDRAVEEQEDETPSLEDEEPVTH